MNFRPGDVVVCIDAADLPSPPWHPLVCGMEYVIRGLVPILDKDANYDKNIHKNAQWCVYLWGISNPIHPTRNIELGYADTRFEKAEASILRIKMVEDERIAA